MSSDFEHQLEKINNNELVEVTFGLLSLEQVEQLSKAMTNNTSVKSMILWNSAIGDEGIKKLCMALKNNHTLLILNLKNNNLHDVSIQHIAEMLENSHLQSLDISSNHMSDEGVPRLAKVLTVNQHLNKFIINNNNISHIGLQAFVKCFKLNKNLTSFEMAQNKLGAQGAILMAQILGDECSLSDLNIAENQIEDRGAQALSEGLLNNRQLLRLDLNNNLITEKGIRHLANALRSNRHLNSIDMFNNNIGSTGIRSLIDALQQNTSILTIEYDDAFIFGNLPTQLEGLLSRNQKIADFKRQSLSLFFIEVDNDHPPHMLNNELDKLAVQLETFSKDFKIYKMLQALLNATMLSIYLKQSNTLEAINFYLNFPDTLETVLLALGEQVLALDLKQHPQFKYSNLEKSDQYHLALIFLTPLYQTHEAQRLIQKITLALIRPADLYLTTGVDLLVPEHELKQLIDILNDIQVHNAVQIDLDGSPQVIYDACQKKPLKSALIKHFGTSIIITIESLLKAPTCMRLPLQTLKEEHNKVALPPAKTDIVKAYQPNRMFSPSIHVINELIKLTHQKEIILEKIEHFHSQHQDESDVSQQAHELQKNITNSHDKNELHQVINDFLICHYNEEEPLSLPTIILNVMTQIESPWQTASDHQTSTFCRSDIESINQQIQTSLKLT